MPLDETHTGTSETVRWGYENSPWCNGIRKQGLYPCYVPRGALGRVPSLSQHDLLCVKVGHLFTETVGP